MSRASCLSPIFNIVARKGTVFTRKGTTEADRKRAENSHILQATRYQAKCEARTGMGQDIPLPYLDRSDHVQTPQQNIVNRCQVQICYTPNCSSAPLWKKFTVMNKKNNLAECYGQEPTTFCLSINHPGEGQKMRD